MNLPFHLWRALGLQFIGVPWVAAATATLAKRPDRARSETPILFSPAAHRMLLSRLWPFFFGVVFPSGERRCRYRRDLMGGANAAGMGRNEFFLMSVDGALPERTVREGDRSTVGYVLIRAMLACPPNFSKP